MTYSSAFSKFVLIRMSKEEKVDHSDNSDEDLIPMKNNLPPMKKADSELSHEKKTCRYCSKAVLKQSLNRHEKYCTSNPEGCQTYMCEHCGAIRNREENLTAHMKKCSSSSPALPRKKSKIACWYPDCNQAFFLKTSLLNHIKDLHDSSVVEEIVKEFETEELFTKWKDEVEYLSSSYFSQKCGENKTHSRYYYCQHDGPSKSHLKNGEDRKTSRRNSKGRVKVGQHCSASMIVKMSDMGTISVRYRPIHNHPLDVEDVKHHPLSADTCAFIDEQIALNKSPLEIQRDLKIQGETLKELTGKDHKNCHISSKLIRERARKMKIEMHLSNNAKSLMLLTEKLIQENPELVLVYKPLGESCLIGPQEINSLPHVKGLFMYAFQTKEQRTLMLEGCKTVLLVDTMLGTNEYEYLLLNLVIVDNNRCGWSVAHCIVNKYDEKLLKFFFKAVKSSCPNFEINCVITEDDQTLVNAMRAGFEMEFRHLLCRWHLLKTFRTQLREKASKILFEEMFSALKLIVDAKNLSDFDRYCVTFKAKFKDKASNFVDYLDTHYLSDLCIPKWASCYRNFPHGPVNTISHVKSFHKRLKSDYIKESPFKGIDELILLLLAIAKDDILARKRISLYGFYKLDARIEDRHRKGLNIPDSCVVPSFENMWEVNSATEPDLCYEVTKLEDNCTDELCVSRCFEIHCPGLCAHMYHCSCEDDEHLCKHIHKVHSFCNKGDTSDNHFEEVEQPTFLEHVTEELANEKNLKETCRKRLIGNLNKLVALAQIRDWDKHVLHKVDAYVDVAAKFAEAGLEHDVTDRAKMEATTFPSDETLRTYIPQMLSFERPNKRASPTDTSAAIACKNKPVEENQLTNIPNDNNDLSEFCDKDGNFPVAEEVHSAPKSFTPAPFQDAERSLMLTQSPNTGPAVKKYIPLATVRRVLKSHFGQSKILTRESESQDMVHTNSIPTPYLITSPEVPSQSLSRPTFRTVRLVSSPYSSCSGSTLRTIRVVPSPSTSLSSPPLRVIRVMSSPVHGKLS